jgi:hypothetical protein
MSDEELTVETQEAPVEYEAEPMYCRHCGEQNEGVAEGEDWLCLQCERYQDSMVCPTCNQVTRSSLMPEDLRPAAHAPKRHRKAKEN